MTIYILYIYYIYIYPKYLIYTYLHRKIHVLLRSQAVEPDQID